MRELGLVGEGESRIELVDLGVMPYREAWKIQAAAVEKRVAGRVPDTLFFVEHLPVITLGRGAQREQSSDVKYSGALSAAAWTMPAPGTEVVEIERGGLATYHGPGQMVVYPIFKLDRKHPDPARAGVVNLIRWLEKWIIESVANFGVSAAPIDGKTGVWVSGPRAEVFTAGTLETPDSNLTPERKIASIGIAVRRWVSFHGLALNYATGVEPWKQINPCGFSANVMTDLSMETGRIITRDQTMNALISRLANSLA